MSLELSLFILGALLVVGWFAAGTHLNVRKGEAALRWLEHGLPLLGEKTTLRWLGSSAVELKIQNPKPPFREAEVLVLLEPRDLPLIWWFSRLRGRRDLFIVRGVLRSLPRHQIEAVDAGAWSARDALRRAREAGWTSVAAPAPLTAYAPSGDATAAHPIAHAALDACPPVRVALRRSEPNLELQWRLADLLRHDSRTVIEAALRVGQAS